MIGSLLKTVMPVWVRWAIIAALFLATLLFGYVKGHEADHKDWMVDKAKQQEQTTALILSTNAKTVALQHAKDTDEGELRAEKDRIANDLAIALDSLHSRDARPIDLPATAGAHAVCTGAGLYREDAEFLSREAAAAKSIAKERDDCAALYDSGKAALEAPK
jgi:hypothetical protein